MITSWSCESDIIQHNIYREFDYILHKHLLGLKDDLIRIWRSKVSQKFILSTSR